MTDDKTPYRSQRASNEGWYTPDWLLDLVREVMGEIDLDPASCEQAQRRVKALEYYDTDANGLLQPWYGRVYINPPYTRKIIDQFVNKLVNEYTAGRISEAIWLSNNSTDTNWFNHLASHASAILFLKSRVRFWMLDENDEEFIGPPLQGQILAYFGK